MSALRQTDTYYTYADYQTWGDEYRYELIEGVPYLMAAPAYKHQFLLGALYRRFAKYSPPATTTTTPISSFTSTCKQVSKNIGSWTLRQRFYAFTS